MGKVQIRDRSCKVVSAVLANAELKVQEDVFSEFKGLIFVRYFDHVLFNRTSALFMKPQIREAVGWLVYECEQYVTLTWDRDAEPPTLKGGDPKASGLVILKSDIMEMKKIDSLIQPLQKSLYGHLNSDSPISKVEYALQPTERKTLNIKEK